MPGEPTTGGVGDAPDQGARDRAPNDQERATPPIAEPVRWFGPSRSADTGAENPPYGSRYGPYQGPQHHPYGPPQSPYGPPQPQNPYGEPQNAPPYSWPYVPPRAPRPQLSPEERRRRTRRGLAFAGTILLAVGAGIGIGAAIAPTSPATVANMLVSRAITSATTARTYHYVELSTVVGEPDDIKGDAAPNGGHQLIRQRCRPVRTDTTNRTSIFDLRLVHGVVYFRGNVVALVDELGVAASRVTSLAGKWVKLVKGEKPYRTFEEGITTNSNASELRSAIFPTSSRTVLGSSPSSTEVVGAALKTKKTNETLGTAVLVMNTSTGRPLTLRASAVLQDTQQYTVSWTFSRFGEKVHVVAPPHPVSYASLHAKPPAKTTCA